MSRLGVALIVSASIVLMVACSDKKKDAAKLEQEMIELEAQADSAVLQAKMDSIPENFDPADVEAVPDEISDQPVLTAMPPVPEGDGFTVQVASCEDEDYARYLVDLYQKRGYEPFVSTVNYEGQQYYRVRVGNFDRSEAATELRDELADKFSIKPWVDHLNR